jgi:fructose-1,6-bisphosphatase/inositol monophosphatase family enzyme
VPGTPAALLPAVIEAARHAGDMLAAEFVRPDGPRFSDHVTSPIDTEMEIFIRDRLMALFPARFVGEEQGAFAATANGFCWIVDPHDGTRAFLEGKRGSAVSIALLRDGIPVLGVVYAPLSPDRGQDTIAWAEGTLGITRNGALVPIALRDRELSDTDVVFLNHGAWQRPFWHADAVAPGRFMPLPSIAYRLARVAVGDGLATVTLRPVNAHDVAAGHALLMAAGGVLTAEDGAPVTYDDQGFSRPSACFGGAPRVVETLRTRKWRGSTEDRREPRIALAWPRSVAESAVDRAVASLLRMAAAGGSEPAVALARTLIGRTEYDPEAAKAAYARWQALSPVNDPRARAVPIGIWAANPDKAAAVARIDAALTHPDEATQNACADIARAAATAEAGRADVPVGDAMRVLTHRPAGLPDEFWADDLCDLAEALLSSDRTHT